MKQRIITASILIIALLVILFLLPFLIPPLLVILFGIALWEWLHITQLRANQAYIIVAITTALTLLAFASPLILALLVGITLLHYVYCPRLLTRFETIKNYQPNNGYLGFIGAVILSTFFAILASWLVCESDNILGIKTLIYVIAVVAAADSGAYFVGRFFGQSKLAPKVSPNKTVEGALGGIASAIAIGLILIPLIKSYDLAWWQLIFALIVIAIASIVGDLFISLIKRKNGIKDTSQILPGHGGLLDRIDGLLAGVPVFYLILMM